MRRFVSIPSRGFWFFEGTCLSTCRGLNYATVSIPSRGFWFFEGTYDACSARSRATVSIPSRGFWFFEATCPSGIASTQVSVSIPSRGFWFFEASRGACHRPGQDRLGFQSPRGDFGFLKTQDIRFHEKAGLWVSIPSRGFWFFEGPRTARPR